MLVIIYGVSHRQMRKCIAFVPDTISDAELAIQLLPRRHATEYFVYGKDKYWREDMVDHTVKVAVPIFNAAFPDCQAVFPPDSASNHSSYAADALRVGNMNLHPGGEQGVLQEGFMHGKGLPQSMPFSSNYYNHELAGKPKGIKRVLKERGLWPERGLVLECSATHNRLGCGPEGGHCARRILEAERDFQDQKGHLQEEVEALGHRVLFTLSFIVSLILSSATGAEQNGLQEKTGFDPEAPKKIVPEGLASVSSASIGSFYRLALRAIDAYSAGVQYGTEEFKQKVYKSHRQVEDRSKW